MSNEEINVLINLHINELEKDIQPTETQKQRVIEALKRATEIIEESNHIPRIN